MSSDKRTSKTIVLTGYGGYNKLRTEHRPIPRVTPGHVIVNVRASGINFAELMARQGLYQRLPKIPAVLGLEASGVITEVGSDVTTVKKGDRIVCLKDFGLWTEFALVEAQSCFLIPDSMSFEEAAALGVNYITAHMMLFDFGNLRPEKSVLVHMAAGGVGIAATQICKTVPNVTVFGTSSASKHEFIKQNGVTHAIDYRTTDYADVIKKHSPQGVDIVLDPLNGKDAVKGFELLKPMGKIVHYGAANVVSGQHKSLWNLAKTYFSTKSYNPLFFLDTNKSMSGYHLGFLVDQPQLIAAVVNDLMSMYDKHQIKPIIDSVWDFDDVGKGMARMHDRQNVGKVIITPDKTLLEFKTSTNSADKL